MEIALILGVIQRLCAEILKVDAQAVAIDRGFHEQGLDSLGATRLSSRLSRELGREVPVVLIWKYPNPAQLAAALA